MTAHRTHPPTRARRETPDIDQLKRQARELLEAYRAQSPDAVVEVAGHHRTATPETFASAEQILWSGASGRSPEIVRMALERIDWPRDDPRWFWMLWRPLP